MKKLSEITGLNLYAINEGMSCDKVFDIFIDPSKKEAAYVVAGSGHSVLSVTLLPFSEIFCIGKDIITTTTVDSIVQIRDCIDMFDKLVSAIDIIGLNVMSVNGSIIGTVSDISFDEKTGRLISILLDTCQVDVEALITISRKIVFVDVEEDKDKEASVSQAVAKTQSAQVELPAQPSPQPVQKESSHSNLVGRNVVKDIFDTDGKLLARRGDLITQELVDTLKEKNKLHSFL